ncbi:hypothetical protein GIB67_032726, partial [Kingdonia uniflora]
MSSSSSVAVTSLEDFQKSILKYSLNDVNLLIIAWSPDHELFNKYMDRGNRAIKMVVKCYICMTYEVGPIQDKMDELIAAVNSNEKLAQVYFLKNMVEVVKTVEDDRDDSFLGKIGRAVKWACAHCGMLHYGRVIHTNNESREAIDLFEKMCGVVLRPDDVAFTGILVASSHGGLMILIREYAHREEFLARIVRATVGAIITDLGYKDDLMPNNHIPPVVEHFLEPIITPDIVAKVFEGKNRLTKLPTASVVSNSKPLTVFSTDQCAELEKILGYTFLNKSFLVEAFTHSSMLAAESHKWYKTLGTAILDHTLVHHMHESNSVALADEQKKIKIARFISHTLSDLNLAYRAIELDLFKFLKYNDFHVQNESTFLGVSFIWWIREIPLPLEIADAESNKGSSGT